MNSWKPKGYVRNGPSWSVSRDQILQTCERKYYFQYLAGARVNATDPMQRRLGMLKKLKNIRMWEGECVHWAIARFLGAIRDQHGLTSDQVLLELKGKMAREWQFSEQKRFRTQSALIDKGGLALVEHEYDSMPDGVNAGTVFEDAARGIRTFVDWAEGAASICAKVRSADNVWIEPPVFGAEAPGFNLDGVQILAKVDLAIEKSGAFFEIYDWKTGEAPSQNKSSISQNELQVCVYQLWPHLSMQLPLELVSSQLVYLGGQIPEVRTHRLDEKSVPLVLLMVRNSVGLAGRWEKNFESGLLRLEDLDYAGWSGSCRECAFKGVCRESLQYENVA
jgi:CRISPR/Cas system-associated exonuclease Cas4 (RecB family)